MSPIVFAHECACSTFFCQKRVIQVFEDIGTNDDENSSKKWPTLSLPHSSQNYTSQVL